MTIMTAEECSAFLYLQTGHRYEDFGFDAAYFGALRSWMHVEADGVDHAAFEFAHFEVLSAYLQAAARDAQWMSIEQENAALAKTQKIAAALLSELFSLNVKGSTAARVRHEILTNEMTSFECDGVTLASIEGDEQALPFTAMNTLLLDLQVALERAKIQKPRPVKPVLAKGPVLPKGKSEKQLLKARVDRPHQRAARQNRPAVDRDQETLNRRFDRQHRHGQR